MLKTVEHFRTFGHISIAVLGKSVKLQEINLLKNNQTTISAILEILS